MKRIIIHCFISLAFVESTSAQTSSPYTVQLKLSKNEMSTWNDFKIVTIVKVLVDTGINVPNEIWTSRLEYPIGDICYDVQINTTKGYKKVHFSTNVDYFSVQDKVKRLLKNEQMSEADNLCLYYGFPKKGDYRVRALYHASKFNKLEDIFSPWIYFKVLNDRLYLTRDSTSTH
jgi:hypothetical protein